MIFQNDVLFELVSTMIFQNDVLCELISTIFQNDVVCELHYSFHYDISE